MKALARLPRWVLVLLALAHAGSSALALWVWWQQIWPNLAAAWIGTVPAVSGLAAIAVGHLKRHIVTHVDRALAAQPPEQGGGSQ